MAKDRGIVKSGSKNELARRLINYEDNLDAKANVSLEDAISRFGKSAVDNWIEMESQQTADDSLIKPNPRWIVAEKYRNGEYEEDEKSPQQKSPQHTVKPKAAKLPKKPPPTKEEQIDAVRRERDAKREKKENDEKAKTAEYVRSRAGKNFDRMLELARKTYNTDDDALKHIQKLYKDVEPSLMGISSINERRKKSTTAVLYRLENPDAEKAEREAEKAEREAEKAKREAEREARRKSTALDQVGIQEWNQKVQNEIKRLREKFKKTGYNFNQVIIEATPDEEENDSDVPLCNVINQIFDKFESLNGNKLAKLTTVINTVQTKYTSFLIGELPDMDSVIRVLLRLFMILNWGDSPPESLFVSNDTNHFYASELIFNRDKYIQIPEFTGRIVAPPPDTHHLTFEDMKEADINIDTTYFFPALCKVPTMISINEAKYIFKTSVQKYDTPPLNCAIPLDYNVMCSLGYHRNYPEVQTTKAFNDYIETSMLHVGIAGSDTSTLTWFDFFVSGREYNKFITDPGVYFKTDVLNWYMSMLSQYNNDTHTVAPMLIYPENIYYKQEYIVRSPYSKDWSVGPKKYHDNELFSPFFSTIVTSGKYDKKDVYKYVKRTLNDITILTKVVGETATFVKIKSRARLNQLFLLNVLGAFQENKRLLFVVNKTMTTSYSGNHYVSGEAFLNEGVLRVIIYDSISSWRTNFNYKKDPPGENDSPTVVDGISTAVILLDAAASIHLGDHTTNVTYDRKYASQPDGIMCGIYSIYSVKELLIRKNLEQMKHLREKKHLVRDYIVAEMLQFKCCGVENLKMIEAPKYTQDDVMVNLASKKFQKYEDYKPHVEGIWIDDIDTHVQSYIDTYFSTNEAKLGEILYMGMPASKNPTYPTWPLLYIAINRQLYSLHSFISVGSEAVYDREKLINGDHLVKFHEVHYHDSGEFSVHFKPENRGWVICYKLFKGEVYDRKYALNNF